MTRFYDKNIKTGAPMTGSARFQKMSQSGLKRSLKGLKMDKRKSVISVLEDKFKGGSLSKDRIIREVGDKLGYNMRHQMEKALSPEDKDIEKRRLMMVKRNLNYARSSRIREESQQYETRLKHRDIIAKALGKAKPKAEDNPAPEIAPHGFAAPIAAGNASIENVKKDGEKKTDEEKANDGPPGLNQKPSGLVI